MPPIARHVRSTVFAPRLQALLREHAGDDLFRLDANTVGVAGPDLIDRILKARPGRPPNSNDRRSNPCMAAPSRARMP